MIQLAHWISRALGDGENPSSARLIAVPTLLLVYLVPLTVWVVAYSESPDHKLPEVPASVLGFIGTVSAPLLTFLHYNKREEMKVEGAAQ